MPGKYSQASTSAPQSEEKLNPSGGKKGVLMNTPTLTWEYTRTLEKGELKRSLTRSTLEVSPIKEDDVYLNTKFQQWVTKNIYSLNNNKQGKVENKTADVNQELLINRRITKGFHETAFMQVMSLI
jgi:hypothetical protein